MTAVRVLSAADAGVLAAVADGVFDGPLRPDLLAEFLGDPRHHIVVAIDDGIVVGMATALHYLHPDKPPEMWINEVGVAPAHRGRGVGGRLVDALLERGRECGCREAWVVTDAVNAAASALYASRGGAAASEASIVYSWVLEDD